MPEGIFWSIVQLFYDSRGDSGAQLPLEFDTGVDAVPEAVDMCIRLMTPNELATVRSSPRFAYDGRADKPPVSDPPLLQLAQQSSIAVYPYSGTAVVMPCAVSSAVCHYLARELTSQANVLAQQHPHAPEIISEHSHHPLEHHAILDRRAVDDR